jgi:5-methyltetrahydrofolate--homocysteine methyltransferase
MGTELQRAGLEPGNCGDEWNLLHPDRVTAIQRAYVEAGSEILLTNTFGTNHFVLRRYGLAADTARIARAAVRAARDAAGDRAWVLGDVGPCGGFLAPLGDVSAEALEASLRETIGAFLDEAVDGIILETMTALDELLLGIRVARELGAPLVIASMAFDRARDGFRTMMGVTVPQAGQGAREAGAHMVGANCGTKLAPRDFAELGRQLHAVSSLPVILQPNAGQPVLEDDKVVYPMTPDAMAAELLDVAAVGRIVGGCCGTTPAHIAAFRRTLDARQASPSV